MKKSDRERAESLEAIIAATAKAKPKRLALNESARTTKEWAAIWGVCRQVAGDKIKAAIDAGVMRNVNVVRMQVNGFPKTFPGYEVV